MSEEIPKINITVGQLFQKYPQIIEEIKRDIARFTIPLIGIRINKNLPEVHLIGSGTLVIIENKYGIITAKHVWEGTKESKGLKEYSHFGVPLSEEKEKEDKFYRATSNLNVIQTSGQVDLAFIELLDDWVSKITDKKKDFFNLSLSKEEILAFEYNPKSVINYIWVDSGFVEERTRVSGSFNGTNKEVLYHFEAVCGFGGIELLKLEIDNDLYKGEVRFEDAANLPTDFSGSSGGGLWRVGLSYDNSCVKYIHNSSAFFGVVIKQKRLMGDSIQRISELISHGPVCTYKNLYQVVLDSKSSALS